MQVNTKEATEELLEQLAYCQESILNVQRINNSADLKIGAANIANMSEKVQNISQPNFTQTLQHR